MLMFEVKRKMKMTCDCVAFHPASFISDGAASKEHAHELRVVKKFPVTGLERLPGTVKKP